MGAVLPIQATSALHTFANFLQLILELLLCVAAGQVAKVQLVLGLRLVQAHLQGRHVTGQLFVLAAGTQRSPCRLFMTVPQLQGMVCCLLMQLTAGLAAPSTLDACGVQAELWYVGNAMLASHVMPALLTSQRMCTREDKDGTLTASSPARALTLTLRPGNPSSSWPANVSTAASAASRVLYTMKPYLQNSQAQTEADTPAYRHITSGTARRVLKA